jgi:hypothetical protein
MNQFPQELFDRICSHLSAEDLRETYYVSTKFRKAAEENAGEHKIDNYEISKEDDLNNFIRYYSGFRIRYLKHVQLNVYFSDPADEDRSCWESAQEQREKDETFTEQVNMIFAALKEIEQCAGERNRGNYRLTICITSYVDEQCLHRQHAQRRTRLLEAEALPELKSVGSLQVLNDTWSAKLDYRNLVDLAARLPNLEYLECRVAQDE